MDERQSASADAVTIHTERETCRACSARTLVPILDLGTQYLPRFVPEPDETLPRAPLRLVRCGDCGLLQLLDTVQPDLLYREFWYRSAVNATMREALTDLVAAGRKHHGRGAWLDIGANDGYLLSRVPDSFRKVACEPALNMREDLGEHADHVVSEYFSARVMDSEAFDVITSAAMFYDLDDPGPFLDDIRACLKRGGIWINQLNDSPTMMRANAFDAICHEHLCYYDIHTLNSLYANHGLRIVSMTHNDVNGGSIRVVAKRAEDVPPSEQLPMVGMPRVTEKDALAFATRTERWKEVFRSHLATWMMSGPVWCYGASTKGGTLLQYLNMPEAFEAVADKNPRKHGLRMVGSWTPIKDEIDFRAAKPRYAVVLPWAFREEFIKREEATRAAGTALVFPLPNLEVVV